MIIARPRAVCSSEKRDLFEEKTANRYNECMEQLSFFPTEDDRQPVSTMWNLWHGCTKTSPGCAHCYVYRRDESVGRDPGIVQKTQNFNLPIRKMRDGRYKIPSGSHFATCFFSDFFHPDADGWRKDAWDMMRSRSDCTFFMITKRPERIKDHLPDDWGPGWDHVSIAVTCENQEMVKKRLPVYLALPLRHYSVMVEPMLSAVDLRPYIDKLDFVSAGGESGPDARPCDYDWVLDLHDQCKENGVSFSYHQTGARLVKDGKIYHIPRSKQHSQAKKAGLDS